MITATFVIRTADQEWVARNGGIVDSDGRVAIQVPADRITEETFAGVPMLRTVLSDMPTDCWNRNVVCPLPLIRKWEQSMGN